MDQVVDSVVKLPPLACGERPVSPGERALNLLAVFLLHAALAYGLLFISVKNELISLPPSISVRLLPMIETPVTEAKPLPPPPPKVPVRTQPVVRPQPVLAVASNTATSSFAVPPQPPPRRPSLSLPRHRQPRRRWRSLLPVSMRIICITPSRFTRLVAAHERGGQGAAQGSRQCPGIGAGGGRLEIERFSVSMRREWMR
jgi:hypothetical protein